MLTRPHSVHKNGAEHHDETERKKSIAELTQNLEGEIKNPLRGIPKAELLEQVTTYQKAHGLPDDILPLLHKGALVAQNPALFETIEGLDDSEKQALREEITHRWKHPWPLYYTIILNSIAAAIQGWDQVSTCISCFCQSMPIHMSGLPYERLL